VTWGQMRRSNLAGRQCPRGEATSESANDLPSRKTLIYRLTQKISSVPVRYSTFARRLGRTPSEGGRPLGFTDASVEGHRPAPDGPANRAAYSRKPMPGAAGGQQSGQPLKIFNNPP